MTSEVTVEAGTTVAEPEAPTKDGYSFLGWYLNGEKYDFTAPVTEDITLVAEFKIIPTGTAAISSRSLITSGILQFKIYVKYSDFNTIDDADLESAALANGGILVWNAANMPEEAVYGTQDDVLKIEKSGTSLCGYMEVNSWEYAEDFYFRPYMEVDGEYVYGEVMPFGVILYCDYQIGYNYTNATKQAKHVKLKNLLAALLNYGAAAQVQFNGETDASKLANAGLQAHVDSGNLDASALELNWDDSYLTDLVEPEEAMTVNFAQAGSLSRKETSLVLKGAISVKPYMTTGSATSEAKFANATEATYYFWEADRYEEILASETPVFTKENASYTKEAAYGKRSGQFCFNASSDGIFAKDYDNTLYFALCVTDSTGAEHCSGIYCYSPEAYADAAITNYGTDATYADLIHLIRWMVVYGERAKIYENA